MQQGQEFDVILLGGSTCAHIDLADLALLAAAATAALRSSSPRNATIRSGRARSCAPARAGFLPTSHSLKVLMGALERVRAGGTYVPLALTETATAGTPDPASGRAPWRELTRRQRDVLALISEGKSNKLIAGALDDVREHGQGARQADHPAACNVANRTQAALLASRASWPQAAALTATRPRKGRCNGLAAAE